MKRLLYVFFICLGIIACSTDFEEIPTLEIGQEFTDSNVRVIEIDTFTVELSTFKFDSIIVDNVSRLLVGSYDDEHFGTVSASTYFEMIPLNYFIDEDGVLDSIALILDYDGYFYNDTTTVSQINVHRLLEEVEPEDDFFYNTSSIAFDPVPLATRNYRPEPFDEDSLHITLPLEFGREIFDAIRDGDIDDDSELTQEFRGLTLQPGTQEDGAVIGFESDFEQTFLRFFYTVEDEFGIEEFTYDVVVNPSSLNEKKFNNVRTDFDNTFFEGLTDPEIELPSSETDQRSFTQSGSGLAMRLHLPSIKELNNLPGTGTLLEATLELRVPLETINSNLKIPDSLSIGVLDQNNDFVSPLFDNTLAVFGLLNEEESEFNSDFFEIPIRSYIDRKLSEDFEVDDALAIYPSSFTQSVDRLIVNGAESENFEAKLIVTYAIYDE